MSYTIYALTAPLEHITWKDVRYVGMSINPTYRFQQHLSRSDTTNGDKNDWIRSLLLQDKTPLLHEVEVVETIEQAREREQYWIRYAIEQGATVFNRAITYTEEERTEVHRKRAIQYAKIAQLIQEGHFVKRSVYWHPSGLNGKADLRKTAHRIKLWEMHKYLFENQQGVLCSIADSTDIDFDTFVKQHISVIDGGYIEWTLEDRIEVINSLLYLDKEIVLYFDADRKFPFSSPSKETKKRN